MEGAGGIASVRLLPIRDHDHQLPAAEDHVPSKAESQAQGVACVLRLVRGTAALQGANRHKVINARCISGFSLALDR